MPYPALVEVAMGHLPLRGTCRALPGGIGRAFRLGCTTATP